VTAFGDMWGCPACDVMNSTDRTECEVCGQRVEFVDDTEIVTPEAVDESGAPGPSTNDGQAVAVAQPADSDFSTADFTQQCKSMLDWTCPSCQAVTHLRERPKMKLSPLAWSLMLLTLLIVGPVALIFGGFIFGVALLLPFLSVALTRPRIISIRCSKCGQTSTEYRRSPVAGLFQG
jgi:hypothetical protein